MLQKSSPKYDFFNAVDGRGTRDDEDDSNDAYVKHRTTCAQLCTLLMERSGNPFSAPSVKAADLDSLYHRYTQIPSGENPFENIERIFGQIQEITDRIAAKQHGRRKVAKITLFALAMYIQDSQRSSQFKLTTEAKAKLARATSEPSIKQNSRAVSGGVIYHYYERWRQALPPGIGVILDPNRAFGEKDREVIRKRQQSKCAICSEYVNSEDEEYDHYPVPYRDGGKTTVDNGRLLHKECHPRGRPADD
ncbi:MAG: HNH endonuclease [Chloroflexi bacterium]|nr:HNH endonuclease [Chloroflexota bacterium]